MASWDISGGSKNRNLDYKVKKAYFSDTLKQVKNALGIYLKRDIKVQEGEGKTKRVKYKDKDGNIKSGTLLIDDEWEGEDL